MIRFALCALLGLLAHPVVAADTLGALLDIPLGASFARLERDLRRTGGRCGLAPICIGAWQGIAAVVERIDG